MRSNRKEIKWFYNDLYMINIYVYSGISTSDTINSIKHNHKINYSEDTFSNCSGKSLEISDGKYIIWIGKKYNIPTLVHESLHICNMILARAGVGVDIKNDEAQAYLLAWIIKKCLGEM